MLIGGGWAPIFEVGSLPQCIHMKCIFGVHLVYFYSQRRKWCLLPWLFCLHLVPICPVCFKMSASIIFSLVIFHKMYILYCRSSCWIYYVISHFLFLAWGGSSFNLYCHSVTPRLANRCVSYVSVKFDKFSISSCGIILGFFLRTCILWYEKMVWWGQFFLCLPALGYGAFIFRATLGVAGFFTLGRSGFPTPFYGDVSTTLVGAPVLFTQALNMFASCPKADFFFVQLVQMLPQYWDVVMPPLNLQWPDRCNQKNT